MKIQRPDLSDRPILIPDEFYVIITSIGTIVARIHEDAIVQIGCTAAYDACMVVSVPVYGWKSKEGSIISEEEMTKLVTNSNISLSDFENVVIDRRDDYIPLRPSLDIMGTEITLFSNSVIAYFPASSGISEAIDRIMGRSPVKKFDAPQGF